MNEALANNLQSHVSDFFQQISMATSPEDVMESESLPFGGHGCRRRYAQREDRHTPFLPKLARLSKLNARNKTPFYAKPMERRSGCQEKDVKESREVRQTPLAGQLLSLKLDQDARLYENMDNTVTEVLNRFVWLVLKLDFVLLDRNILVRNPLVVEANAQSV